MERCPCHTRRCAKSIDGKVQDYIFHDIHGYKDHLFPFALYAYDVRFQDANGSGGVNFDTSVRSICSVGLKPKWWHFPVELVHTPALMDYEVSPISFCCVTIYPGIELPQRKQQTKKLERIWGPIRKLISSNYS